MTGLATFTVLAARPGRLPLVALLFLAHACGPTRDTGGPGRAGTGGHAGAAGSAGLAGAGGSGAAAAAGGPGSHGGSTATDGAPDGSDGDSSARDGSDGGATDGAPDGSVAPPDAGPFVPLGLNDVTILAPLPTSSSSPVLLRGADLVDDGTALVPRALVDRVLKDGATGQPLPTLVPVYERLHLVAVRFDLCDRHLPGECPTAEDARMRLVLQPIDDQASAPDVGFHAFYAIRNDEIADAVAMLRDLARTAPASSGPLQVSPALSAANPEPYAAKLRAVVRRFGGETRIVRLTVNAQNLRFAQFVWTLQGVEKRGDAFVDMAIAGATDLSESVTLASNVGYDVRPVTDTPPGLLGAIAPGRFDSADAATRTAYLAALAAVENPMTHTAETVACVGCHVSTAVMRARTAGTVIDPLTLPGRYTSTFDLSIAAGKSAETPRTLRALGYLLKDPMISQRVVNDTAQALLEIERRYPPR